MAGVTRGKAKDKSQDVAVQCVPTSRVFGAALDYQTAELNCKAFLSAVVNHEESSQEFKK